MSDLKTKKNEQSVEAFIESLEDDRKKEESYVLIDLMCAVTGDEPDHVGQQHRRFRQVPLRVRERR